MVLLDNFLEERMNKIKLKNIYPNGICVVKDFSKMRLNY